MSRPDPFPEHMEHMEHITSGLNTQVIGRTVRYFPLVDSTQNAAREAAHVGAPEGATFVADEQRIGRGRMGRPWVAPAGSSLLLSVVVRPTLERYQRLSIIAALATAEAIEMETRLTVELKWPNDCLIDGKKTGGILVEGEFAGEAPNFAVIGIGINVNLDPAAVPSPRYQVTSLSRETGAPVSRVRLGQRLLERLEQHYLHTAQNETHRLWQSRLTTLGRRVTVLAGDTTITGTAENVDALGALLLRTEDGDLRALTAGEVTIQNVLPPEEGGR